MNQLAVHTGATHLPPLPEKVTIPPLSRAMIDAEWGTRSGRDPAPVIRAEAVTLLAETRSMLALAKPVQVKNWLERVNLGTSQPISPTALDLRAAAMIPALREYPAGLFTVETANAAMLSFKWFPGAAEIVEFLSPWNARLHAFADPLKKIVAFVPAPERAVPTDEEREAVRRTIGTAFRLPGSVIPEPVRSVEEQLALLRGSAS